MDEPNGEFDEELSIYVCTACGERSLKIEGSIVTKAYQPDGWGCDCEGEDGDFYPIALLPHGEA